MRVHEYDLLNYLLKVGYTSQRKIAEETGYSLGKVNELLQKLMSENYLKEDFSLTNKIKQESEEKKPENAIILAAGFGMRMVPINTEVPKGLLEVNDETLIERLIKQLHEVGVYKIDIVVGYMKDYYEFLIDQYDVNLIYNPDYVLKNNIHSLNLLANKLSNSYILPCDIWSRNNPFSKNEFYSWYSVTDVKNEKSNVRRNRQQKLQEVNKGDKGNKMIGIAYLLKEDSKQLKKNLEILTDNPDYDHVFWERALLKNPEKLTVNAKVYSSEDVVEIDTYEQLRALDSQSNHLNTEILKLIGEVLKVDSKEIKKIEVLKKGMTNRSFKFSVRNKSYIMRIPGEGTNEIINRQQEYEVYQKIKDLKISDHLVYISADNGYKITEFLDNNRECDPNNPSDVKKAMNKLKEFHDLDLEIGHSFNLFNQIQFYEDLWEGKSSVFRDYKETKENIFTLKEMIDTIPKERTLTHIDANPDNMLFVGDEIRMIDWEYAAMQDPHLDIAMFAVYSLYNRQEVDSLMDLYFTEAIEWQTRMKIYAYIAIAGLLWSNWCEFKRFEGVEFGEYSLRQYRYAKDYYKIVKDEFLDKNKN